MTAADARSLVLDPDFVAKMSAMRKIARRPASTFWYGHVLTPSHLASMGRTGTVTWPYSQ